MMNKYQVILNGQNFLMDTDDGEKKVGFFTARMVKANSVGEAKQLALDMVKKDKVLIELTLNEPADQPQIHIDEVNQVREEAELEQSGYSFYSEED